jgi:hypothetical protein
MRTAVTQAEEILDDGTRVPVEIVSVYDNEDDFVRSSIEPRPGLPTVRNPGPV